MTIVNWRKLAWPIAVFGMALLLLVTSKMSEMRAQAQLRNAQQNLAAAQEHARAQQAEAAELAKLLPAYDRLRQRGFIGPERRMDWVDALREASLDHQLFAASYEISTQQDEPGDSALHRSTMNLTLPLLHEGDLLMLLHALSRETLPPFLLRECTLIRKGDERSPQLEAVCTLDWITMTTGSK